MVKASGRKVSTKGLLSLRKKSFIKHISGSVYHIIIKKFLLKCGASIKMDKEKKASLLYFR